MNISVGFPSRTVRQVALFLSLTVFAINQPELVEGVEGEAPRALPVEETPPLVGGDGPAVGGQRGRMATRAPIIPAEEIVQRSQGAFFYAGPDMKARVAMELIAGGGARRTRSLTMLRKNDGRNQKYFMYFHEPGDVRGTAFLVWKYPEKDDDRWIFIPAVNLVRRIAARDSRSSFVGSDFTYEDVSGRDLSADLHTLAREEKLNEAECYVVESVPKGPADFTKKISWIDKKTFLPLKEEYYDAQGELARVLTADRIENVNGGGKTYPTVMKRTMKNVKSGHATEVVFSGVAYEVGLDEGVFTEQTLQTPPQKWIQ